jgi:hypothetical protein
MMQAEVEKIIEAEIKPKLRAHGGDIEVIMVEEGIVQINNLGNKGNTFFFRIYRKRTGFVYEH